MNALSKSTKLPKNLFKSNGIFFTIVRNGHWNKDFKPGPYPKTEAERAAAAKKYNLSLAEYKPYPDDGTGRGDYPALPRISGESKDPFYPWDYPEMKRNYSEPIHDNLDEFREDRWDCSATYFKSQTRMLAEFFAAMGGCFLLFWLFEKIKMFPSIIPKQYPRKGKVHYTFEKCT